MCWKNVRSSEVMNLCVSVAHLARYEHQLAKKAVHVLMFFDGAPDDPVYIYSQPRQDTRRCGECGMCVCAEDM